MRLHERPRPRLFVRAEGLGRAVSCLVFIPRDHFDARLRARIARITGDRVRRRVRGVFHFGRRRSAGAASCHRAHVPRRRAALQRGSHRGAHRRGGAQLGGRSRGRAGGRARRRARGNAAAPLRFRLSAELPEPVRGAHGGRRHRARRGSARRRGVGARAFSAPTTPPTTPPASKSTAAANSWRCPTYCPRWKTWACG